jgi:FKBP-type peptidyl-prolyl cis-trans isomerase
MRNLLSAAALLLAACSPSVPNIATTKYDAKLNVDISQSTRLANGDYIRDTTTGTGADVGAPGQIVSIYYAVYLPNGVLVDTNEGGDVYNFTIGQHQIIPGLEQGVAGMKVGGVRQIIVPPALAYGDDDTQGSIPPESILVFDSVTVTAVR